MKKAWLIFFIFIASCSSSDSDHKNKKSKYRANNNSSFKRVDSKFANKISPSESMQAGIEKKKSFYSFATTDSDSNDDQFTKNSLELKYVEDQNIVNDKGEYVGQFKIGNPYEVQGVAYFPQNYEDYSETGVASWYGDDFHGKPTANGEVYNMASMTAAHRTLPLPSMVRVTNLNNGKNVIVRVNDRGPFAKNRVIDVSERAAVMLDFKDKGTTNVKVELLRNDTNELLKALKGTSKN